MFCMRSGITSLATGAVMSSILGQEGKVSAEVRLGLGFRRLLVSGVCGLGLLAVNMGVKDIGG